MGTFELGYSLLGSSASHLYAQGCMIYSLRRRFTHTERRALDPRAVSVTS